MSETQSHEARGDEVWRLNGYYEDAPEDIGRGDFPVCTVSDHMADPEEVAAWIAGRLDALTFADFSRQNLRRCEADTGFGHPIGGWSLSDWMTATVGELGEAANVAKKLNRVRDGIVGNSESPEELQAALADELADTFIYLELLAQSQGINLAEAVVDKFNRTSDKIGCPIKIGGG